MQKKRLHPPHLVGILVGFAAVIGAVVYFSAGARAPIRWVWLVDGPAAPVLLSERSQTERSTP